MTRYPVGKQDFQTLREGGYVYIDKTQYIDKLLKGSQAYFLSRPRRFGKSLFVSTLECFFQGKKELFTGLAVDSPDRVWKEYPVIRIDLGAENYKEKNALQIHVSGILDMYEEIYGINRVGAATLSSRFSVLIRKAYEVTGRRVVVLVDEYEKPLTDLIDDTEKMEESRQTLQGFYSVLKSYDKILKLVFFTGVTKFGQMNVFSGLNNLKDISLNDDYDAICGITEEELLENLEEGINKLAASRKTDFTQAAELLKENYDGYHFSKYGPDIYNPFSLICALDDSEINSYWASTGTPSLLVRVLLKSNYEVLDFNGIAVSKRRLSEFDNVFSDPVTLFYQTGYLTIKGYDEDSDLYILGYPNREVEQAFFNYILPYYYSKDIHVDSLNDSLRPQSRRNVNAGSQMCVRYGSAVEGAYRDMRLRQRVIDDVQLRV